MSSLDLAISLAEMGFHVFPLLPNAKTPAIKDWQSKASNETDVLRKLFSDDNYNVGIYTGVFRDGALVVIDIDNKNGKSGDEEIIRLEIEGKEFPPTLEANTASGGRHLFYYSQVPRKQGANVFGEGIDVRSRGGYVVAAGSVVDGASYSWANHGSRVAACPDWVSDFLCANKDVVRDTTPVTVASAHATDRVIEYLQAAPLAIEGSAGDQTTYQVAACVKDFGVDESTCYALMSEHWNTRCAPPWCEEDLARKVGNAYKYGQFAQGASSPEADFEYVEVEQYKKDPALEVFNAEFAVADMGGDVRILHEVSHPDGTMSVEFMGKEDFNTLMANRKIVTDKGKLVPAAKLWLEYVGRRTYFSVVFDPSGRADRSAYNLWRGFKVSPAETPDHPMVDRWKEHALENICRGDKSLYHWLMCYFAHLVQRPHEKALTALVFKGGKGVGKNALIERVTKSIIGDDYGIVFSDRRYLTSNFNSHFDKCLVAVLDEAFWSGDKAAEGRIKDLITGDRHMIERKGMEPYAVKNLTRVVFISNESWVVPASSDERRFAVFNVGDGRKQDTKYFHEMRVGLDEEGGAAHLLRFLLDYKIDVNINVAPQTEGLDAQKVASLDDVSSWWLESLQQGALVGCTRDDWPEYISRQDISDAVSNYYKRRGIRSRVPTFDSIIQTILQTGTALEYKKLSQKHFGQVGATYGVKLPELSDGRAGFSKAMKMDIEWAE